MQNYAVDLKVFILNSLRYDSGNFFFHKIILIIVNIRFWYLLLGIQNSLHISIELWCWMINLHI